MEKSTSVTSSLEAATIYTESNASLEDYEATESNCFEDDFEDYSGSEENEEEQKEEIVFSQNLKKDSSLENVELLSYSSQGFSETTEENDEFDDDDDESVGLSLLRSSLDHLVLSQPRKAKGPAQANFDKSFSRERIREIQRSNQILLQKIMTQGSNAPKKGYVTVNNVSFIEFYKFNIICNILHYFSLKIQSQIQELRVLPSTGKSIKDKLTWITGFCRKSWNRLGKIDVRCGENEK